MLLYNHHPFQYILNAYICQKISLGILEDEEGFATLYMDDPTVYTSSFIVNCYLLLE